MSGAKYSSPIQYSSANPSSPSEIDPVAHQCSGGLIPEFPEGCTQTATKGKQLASVNIRAAKKLKYLLLVDLLDQ